MSLEHVPDRPDVQIQNVTPEIAPHNETDIEVVNRELDRIRDEEAEEEQHKNTVDKIKKSELPSTDQNIHPDHPTLQ